MNSKEQQKLALEKSIEEKDKEINILNIIFKKIKKFQENKNKKLENQKIMELEEDLLKL